MADGILYLDIDDEITSAAARVRAVEGGRVAVVLPYGSRVATSRINFRLLARDALTHEKRLSVVASDSATRALAASAGLPVFASVQEYEASLPPPRTAPDEPAVDTPPASAAAVRKAKRAAAGTAAAAAAGGAGADAAGATGAAAGAGAGSKSAAGPSGRAMDVPEPAADAASGADPASTGTDTARVAAPADEAAPDRTTRVAAAGLAGAAASGPVRPDTATSAATTDTVRRPTVSVTPSRGGHRRTPLIVGLGVLGLALLVGIVGAYLFLPSAQIVVTPKTETLGPIQLTVVADPETTEPDVEAGTVPAEVLSVDVTTSDTFPATGKRVEETAAKGTVRFRNVDFTSANTIPGGSIVSTSGGIRFRTNRSVTVGAATLVGLQIVPKTASVAVTAVEPGPEGNVEPNTILTIPRGESPVTLSVTNPEATTGGTREEFPKVARADVDKAMATLDAALQAEFATQVADPALAPSGSTVFPETAVLGEATPTVDPKTLVGTETATFELGLSATGTVTAVDDAPVSTIAEARLRDSVAAGSQLVEDSITIDVGAAVVTGGVVSFPVTASATQVAVLDPDELKAQILGKTPDEATAILAPYGAAEIDLSPGWVTTIPTFENRVDLTIAGGPDETPAASPSP